MLICLVFAMLVAYCDLDEVCNNAAMTTIDKTLSQLSHLYALDAKSLEREAPFAREIFGHMLDHLESGELRAAYFDGHEWQVETRVKEGILLGFKLGKLSGSSAGDLGFCDKDTVPVQNFCKESNVRIVPGGTSVRRGAYVSPGVVVMPPAYINIGAYVGKGTMVDSHALVGSCAQVGKNVHLSAASQIGGVLEPIGAMPVIVEDNVFVGGNCGIYEGTTLKKGCVLAAGVILTSGTQVYDLVNEEVLRGSEEVPLTIPENAIVVPGSRPAKGAFAKSHNLQVSAPMIVKYKGQKSHAKLEMEQNLR